MRRVALLPALAVLVAPALAFAQPAPAQPHSGATNPPGDQTAPTTPAAPDQTQDGAAPAGEGASTTPASLPPVESPPVVPPANEGEGHAAVNPHPATDHGPGLPTPLPPPENLDVRTTPIVELHGYFRARFELFQNFDMGWAAQNNVPLSQMTYNGAQLPWYRNPDYSSNNCISPPGFPTPIPSTGGQCLNATQTSANMRLRLNPEIHPTEWITIHSQVDVLDNLVLGSTPAGYYAPNMSPNTTVVGQMPNTSPGPMGSRNIGPAITFLGNSQNPPIYGVNSFTNSIVVKRAWAEISHQTLGELRVGRMPWHWGLGMIANAGNGMDSDFQTTVDRVMYTTRIRPLALNVAAMYDFMSTGATSASIADDPGEGQQHDLSFYDDVRQGTVAIWRALDPAAQRAALARGEVVFTGGGQFTYRNQFLSGEGTNCANAGISGTPVSTLCPNPQNIRDYATTGYGANLVPRNAWSFTPDLWVQLRGQNFRIEAEAAYTRGEMYTGGVINPTNANYYIMSSFGGVLDAEYRLLNQRLLLAFKTGYATGDPEINGYRYQTGANGLQSQALNDRFLTLFSFHPDYRIDLIYWRQIQQQFAGAYFFRPGIAYSLIDEPNGDLLFGRVDAIWSRASEFMSTRGQHADLGIELDATIQYQSNHRRADSPDQRPLPGLYAFVQYGIFFPMAGLGPTDVEHASGPLATFQLQIAQTVRGYVGVTF